MEKNTVCARKFPKKYALTRGIRRDMGKALGDFSMISEGDRILLGLSGGKDSLVLLLALRELQQRSPVTFSLQACTVDPLEEDWDASYLENLCAFLGVSWVRKKQSIFEIIKHRNERSPCSFCANMRRGVLSSTARECGCNVLALGHHQDDVIETVFLNLFSGGRFRCFSPRLYQSKTEVTVIRPFVYLSENRIAREAQRLALEPVSPPCPYEKSSSREQIKLLVRRMENEVPGLRSKILHALTHGTPEDTWAFLKKPT